MHIHGSVEPLIWKDIIFSITEKKKNGLSGSVGGFTDW
jgi:hypothetical protein